ncbi:MAG: MG2 domain-containing protein [Candidatus Eremiobacterota bacterium]
MRKIFCLFFIILTAGILFTAGLAEDKESYYVSHYFTSNLHYPGEKIPLSLSLYSYNLRKKGNFNEDVNIKIYKIPADLSSDKYDAFIAKEKPVEELDETVNMESYSSSYWSCYHSLALPSLSSGNYFIICSTDNAKSSGSFRVSHIAMSAKSSKEFILLFVQDHKTGNLLENVDISVYLTGETKKIKTDKEGRAILYYRDLKASPDNIKIIAFKGDDTAEINMSPFAEASTFKGYIYTDRPVYRPAQKVNFKGILRMEKNSSLDFIRDEVKISIYDPQSSEVYKNTLKTDDFGSVSDNFALKEEPALGNYSVTCLHSSGQKAYGTFQVQEYRKPEFEINIKPEKEHYIQGEKLTFNMDVKYYFGSPVPDTDYTYEIYRSYYYPYFWNYWWEEDILPYYNNYSGEFISSGKGKTDKNGKATFICDAAKADYDANYTVTVRMTDESRREVTGSAGSLVTAGAYYITVTPEKYFYEPGDKAQVKIATKDYDGKPVSSDITLNLKYEFYNEKLKKWEWKELDRVTLKTDDTGIAYYDFLPDKDGYYQLESKGLDSYKNEIKSTGNIYCYGGGYYNWYRFTNIEIIPDKNMYEAGDKGKFFIVCPFPVKALVSVEGEEVFTQKTVDFSNKTASLEVDITKKHTPNFYVTVSFFYEGNFYYQTKKIICPSKDKFLNVSVESDKEKYRPRDTARFILKTTDQNNRPVSSQITMGIADESVYAVVNDNTPNIQKFFYGLRKNQVLTCNSNGNVYGRDYDYRDYDGFCDYAAGPMPPPPCPPCVKMELGDAPKESTGKTPVQPDFTRSFFPDTAYFNPNIITDEKGIAEVPVAMPDTLTTWRATARAVSKDTKVGENTEKVTVTKNLLARLITTRFYTERDEAVITGVIHNYLKSEKTVTAQLEINGGIDLLDKEEFSIKIPADGSKSVNWKVKVKKTGDVKIKLTALTDEESDAVELTVPVLPHGTEKYVAAGGITKDVAEEILTLPKDAEKGSAKCIITLDPSLASTVLSSLDYLVGYPYGCVEQTMSRFLPNVIVTKTLGELDIYNEKINKELPDMVKKGFERLYNFHHSDGGWGWWENDESHPYMTAYVVYGFTMAKEAGYSVDESKLKAGIGWLREHYKKEENLNTKAYMVFALTEAGEDVKQWPGELYEKREKLDSYGKAVLALSLDKGGLKTEAKEVVNLLEKSAEISGTTASWSGMTGSHGWTDNTVETTSYCLTALLNIKPDSELISKVVRYLSTSRNGSYWYSTKDTAAAVMALTGYIKNTKEMNPDFTAAVYLNGTKIDTVKFTKEDVGKEGHKIEIPFDRGLLDGENKIRFEMTGKGMLYYAAYMKYYTEEEQVKSLNSGFKVTRTYYLLKPEAKDPDKDKIKLGSSGSINVKSQDIILVELDITGASNYEYIMIEDPKPAGCEFDEKQRENYRDWNYWYAHKELRDEKIAYFCTYYSAGTRKVTYRLRAETPGTFHVMPARASAMYSPEIGGNSDEVIMKIADK